MLAQTDLEKQKLREKGEIRDRDFQADYKLEKLKEIAKLAKDTNKL